MLGSVPSVQKNLGTPLQSRRAMLETLCRHLDMVRLSAAGVLMIALVGCTGLIDGGSDGMTDEQRDARAKWVDEALPVLRTNCASCHNGSRPMVGFLMGAEDFEIHDKLVKFEPPVVNLEAVSSSRILTKGLHDGPVLTAEQSSSLLTWLQAERQFANNDPDNPIIQIATQKAQVQLCTGGDPDNTAGTCPTTHIPLEKVPTDGTTLGGAEISFVAQGLQSGLYLTRLAVTGGTTGVYLEHALFVSLPASPALPFPDQIDRYFALKMNVPAGMTMPISGGTDLFFGFAGTDSIEIHFKKLGAFQPDTNQPKNDGCKMLAQFKANAVTQLNTNCASCHQGNANATAKAAMDVTGLGAADDATVLLACNQVRSRINLTNTDQSGFYLAPSPAAGGNHPFKFNNNQAAFNAFKTAMDVWVKAEQTAP
jgi:mono/diheme cytochrome c family protein